jgi:hypothetical protein
MEPDPFLFLFLFLFLTRPHKSWSPRFSPAPQKLEPPVFRGQEAGARGFPRVRSWSPRFSAGKKLEPRFSLGIPDGFAVRGSSS